MGKTKWMGPAMAVSLALTTSPIQAQERGEVRSFALSGSWTLDAGDDYCRLAGNFTNGEDQIALALERNRAEPRARLILVGEQIRPFRGAETISWSYQPAGQPTPAAYLRNETPDGRPYFNLGMISFAPAGPPQIPPPPYNRMAELEFAQAVTAIQIDQGLVNPVRLETGSMLAPLQALQVCTDDLLLYWGLDFEKHKTMTRPAGPAGPAFEWLAADTIGFGDFASLSAGRNPIRVMVDAQGQPTECHVHWASLPERKNEAICEQLMANARFEPALDAEGNPMASYWFAEPFMLMRPMGGPRG